MSVHSKVIEGPYLRDLLDQPGAIERTLRQLRADGKLRAIAGDFAAGRFQRIVLTAMGGSLHALHPFYLRLIATGHAPHAVETSELIRYESNLLGEGTLVIAVSQSGRSAELLAMLAQGANGSTVLGVTNYADSPLAERADAALVMAAGEESTVSCKTYVATLVTLTWLAGELLGAQGNVRRELEAAAPALERYLQNWRAHVDEMGAHLQPMRQLFLVGRGESLAAARAGGLTLKESAHVHAEGMSAAAFRHGPFEMISPEVFVFVFAGAEATRELNRKLAHDVKHEGGRAEMIDFDSPPGPFCLPQAPESVRPILEVLPVQMASLALAAMKGREAGRFVRLTKVTTVE